ncbi:MULTISPECIES: PfkB family carbohydrate kinase [unclassified Pseudonocardia]|uniref:PfkB family carbohydrate kinase n=1 Tax=unclassified Pseudonocardia TaxID=2619320 RepID=UPI0025FA49B2|nr:MULTISPECIES: PfkB family carbohydrate kinase [unclassified Pseudonocardia]
MHRGLGGKGANRAVAPARLGRPVAMVGAVGDDLDGDLLRDALVAEGIDVGASRRRRRCGATGPGRAGRAGRRHERG